jgi:hypothetical protein
MYHRLLYVSKCIFGRIDIMYHKLPYVFRGVLPFKALVLYIYRPRDTMTITTISLILFSNRISSLTWTRIRTLQLESNPLLYP